MSLTFTGYKRFALKVLSPVVVLAVSSIVTATPSLQQSPPSGNGGVIVEGQLGGFDGFNPLFESNAVTTLLFPELIGINPDTGFFQKDAPNALATDWTISEDGTVYAFKLRPNWVWTDGVPISSKDMLYTWNAIKSGDVDSWLGYLKEDIVKVEAPDPTTLQITFATANCNALNSASALPILPSHVLPNDFSTLNKIEFNTNPSVTGGIFQFEAFAPADKVVLTVNPTRTNDSPLLSGYVYQSVLDQSQLIHDFMDRKLDIIINPPSVNYAALRNNPSVNTYTFAGNTWDYLALNYADPLHSANGYDEKGNKLNQGHHPLFGDVRVRQAIARAIDVDALIKGAVSGEATRMTSSIISSSWAYNNTLPPIAYDLNAAKRLLEDAGWIDDDHDANTPRIARGAQYAPDGTPFKFTLYTNEGGTRRDSIAALIREQLCLVGIEVDVQVIDFNTLLGIIYNQKFDAFILGWRNAYPDNPDLTDMFTPAGDVLGKGSNFTSYDNPGVVELNSQALSLSGCDPEARAEIYRKIQVIMQQDLPYIWLYSLNEMYAAQKTVRGFDPRPNQPYWNIVKWSKPIP